MESRSQAAWKRVWIPPDETGELILDVPAGSPAALLFVSLAPLQAAEKSEPPKPPSHTVRTIEGWTVRVDDRLLAPPNDALGTRALRFLEYKLADINAVVAAEPLAKLQGVTLVLDLSHGKLRAMQYHPDAGWLQENGYATNLVARQTCPNLFSMQ